MNRCLTKSCNRFIPQNTYRCEPCARKLSEHIHAYRAEQVRVSQIEEFSSTLSMEDISHSPRSFSMYPQREKISWWEIVSNTDWSKIYSFIREDYQKMCSYIKP